MGTEGTDERDEAAGRLAWSDTGTGPGRPLVLLHGIGSNRHRWDPIVAQLAAGHRCIAVDLPGHGDSPMDGCDSVSAALAVQALIAHLGLRDAAVVGHSLGATVALLHAAVCGGGPVTAVDPVPLHLPALADSLAPYADRLQGDDFEDAFLEWEQTLDHGPPAAGAPTWADQLEPRAETVLSYWRPLLARADAEAVLGGFRAALGSIPSPVLVLLAAEPTPEDAELLAEIPDATVEVFAGQGHWLHLVDPNRFATRVRTWLDDRDDPTAASPG